jgi:hypothetical protein
MIMDNRNEANQRPEKTVGRRARTLLAMALSSGLSIACAMEEPYAEKGDLQIRVSTGAAWLHRYSLLQKNPPQIALWAETTAGTFAGTLFASRKAATGTWLFSGGNPRKEALPVWSSRKASEKPDGITGASPARDFELALTPRAEMPRAFVLFAEVNHSTDFNDAYPKKAKPGEADYSGGEGGSGQPSLVYRCDVNLDAAVVCYEFTLVGHGSPDGSDGRIDADLSGVTDALDIVRRISAERKR